MKELEQAVLTLQGQVAALTASNIELRDELAVSTECVEYLKGAVNGVTYESDELDEGETADERRASSMGILERLNEIEGLVRGRNRSAATKRNMTDADAVECLTGAAAALDHKEAGEKLGLTYAQVYSCRLEYTFKHVHKQLREKGWKNGWVKK